MTSPRPALPAVHPPHRQATRANTTRLAGDRLEEVVTVLDRARSLLAWDVALTPGELAEHGTARRLLREAWDRTVQRLGEVAIAHPLGVADTDLLGLLESVRSADDHVRADAAHRTSRAAQAVHTALGMLGAPGSVLALLKGATVAAASLGFDRVLLSRIENSLWIPEVAYFDRDPTWADQLVDVGRQHPRTLDSTLIESEMMRRRTALRVTDAQGKPMVHPELAAVTLSRSYVAAPITAGGQVIAFMHADCYFQQRHPDPTDRDLLWLFCESMGHALARASALDRLEAMRARAERIAGCAQAVARSCDWSGTSGPGAVQPIASERRPAMVRGLPDLFDGDDPDGVITRREVEVLRLMASGATNAQIAARLTISEGTVKTHVKHILRKLDAANRAEAVSRWLRNNRDHAREGRGVPARTVG